MNVQLITIGQLTIDDLVLPDGRTYMETPGGNALYSAVGAAHFLPGVVGLLSRVGSDYSAAALEALSACGVLPMLQPLDEPHMRGWLIYETTSERRALSRNVLEPPISVASFRTYLRQYRELLRRFSPGVTDLPKSVKGVRAFHVAPQIASRHLTAVPTLRRRYPSALISVDPSPFYFRPGGEPSVRKILTQVDMVLPSREELKSLFGAVTLGEALRSLTGWGPRIAVAKLGPSGAVAYDGETDRFWICDPVPDARLVDPTGAGDAFCGAFLASYLQTGDLAVSLRRATAVGATAISGMGPSALFESKSAALLELANRVAIRSASDCTIQL